ncbi:MAG: CvpA family protein [Burkholderiales bacterium]|nr:CvpA family protein [Burkholderiales bacterium]
MQLGNFNGVDLLLAAVVLLGAYSGWRSGFVLAALELVALLASIVVAFVGYPLVGQLVDAAWPAGGVWVAPLAFVATFLLAHLLFGAIAGRIIVSVPRRAHAHGVNRLFGVAPGLASGLVNATVVALMLLTLPLSDGLSRMAREGEIGSRLTQTAEWLEARLGPIFDPAVRRTLQALTVPVESNRTVPLNFKVAQPKLRPDLEERMLDMVNAERAEHGLKPLQADRELQQVARAHSRDMFARGYFSHVSPEGEDLRDRLDEAHARYLAAGENLALAQTLPIAHQGLMNSPGHRENILRPQFGHLGIGVLDGGSHGLMVTQNFRN